MFTKIIVHKIKYIFTFIFFIGALMITVKEISATQVRNIMIDPALPIYNQPFNCAITLDQDDHRNACSLLPLNAPAGMIPWDICTIDTVSADKLTRFYHCIANQAKKVPGPGNYQIVDWNFTGDGETGKVIYSRSITIQNQPPPPPTSPPKPNPTNYVQPTESILTESPTSPPLLQNTSPPTAPRIPTIINFSINSQDGGVNLQTPSPQKKISTFIITLPTLPKFSIPNGVVDKVNGAINPLINLVLAFLKETNY